MRMWNVKPELLCNKHLLGEHVEMHMFAGTIKRNKSIKGFLSKGFVETGNITKRHNELATEMLKRGINHKSELTLDVKNNEGFVDVLNSLADLAKRCEKCRELQNQKV